MQKEDSLDISFSVVRDLDLYRIMRIPHLGWVSAQDLHISLAQIFERGLGHLTFLLPCAGLLVLKYIFKDLPLNSVDMATSAMSKRSDILERFARLGL